MGRSEIPEGGGAEPHRALVSPLSVSLPPQSPPGPSLQEPPLALDSLAAQLVLLVRFVVERDSSHEKQPPKVHANLRGLGESQATPESFSPGKPRAAVSMLEHQRSRPTLTTPTDPQTQTGPLRMLGLKSRALT